MKKYFLFIFLLCASSYIRVQAAQMSQVKPVNSAKINELMSLMFNNVQLKNLVHITCGQVLEQIPSDYLINIEAEQLESNLLDMLVQECSSFTDLAQECQKVYSEYFDEHDIDCILTFYKSPVGTKVLNIMPIMSIKVGKLLAEKVQSLIIEKFCSSKSSMVFSNNS